ncbi:MAG: cytochrome c oxidase subunit II [Trichodesmium sp. St16_bin4-tuft]|nr:cytochrome c oxidase subunit II [Trichodesmium sp. MAG_R01]MDE5068675.1 cytochrome c oxidase subunit II [Trichodesmium sp. St4_bin8_1]MDE5070911.1 cytochrome c oxidase subunit II [Trichodesmium sp. St5_bin8]MDE5077337.1 cytochrome c oxidase subunit II [Trichodesmium sp. St2_bin6]MDE5091399.1 cytochrome c oxidase subunit II [Trichodesmium sp. St18_bin3_1_1]MDE5099134.1 cytochrome c oxidase subunit II [Trichodesmium sp. St16_bin4-tuft]MDE5101522.1 cytochrome c oxidase subunit II [Trichodesmi
MEEKEKVPVSIITLVVGIVVTIISLWAGQNHGLLPEAASEQAPLVDRFFDIMFTIATGLFIIVEGTIVFCMIKFRRRQGDDSDGANFRENLPLEIFWTAIPSIIVIGLGIYSVDIYRQMGGFDPNSTMVADHHAPSHQEVAKMRGSAIAAPLIADTEGMEATKVASKYGFGATPQGVGKEADVIVDITGIQYGWLMNYPDSGVFAGELHIPVNKDIQINLSAQDVIHSFWIPAFRLKQDAIPGKETQLRFVATKIGEYPVYCAELCGSYHGAMRTTVVVQTQEEYAAWIEENTFAQQQELNQAIAVNTADLSDSEYLQPYSEEIGIDSETLNHINQTYH